MSIPDFFELNIFNPIIYAYEIKDEIRYKGFINIGYAENNDENNIKELINANTISYNMLGIWSAIKNDGTFFTCQDVAYVLKQNGKTSLEQSDSNSVCFKCTLIDIKLAIKSLMNGSIICRTASYTMHNYQKQAVETTMQYFTFVKNSGNINQHHFLWNISYNFNAPFVSYQLAKAMDLKYIIVITTANSEHDAWKNMLLTHVDFKDWLHLTEQHEPNTIKTPAVYVTSLKHFLDETNDSFCQNNIKWDLVINSSNFDFHLHNLIDASYYLHLCNFPSYFEKENFIKKASIYNWNYFDEKPHTVMFAYKIKELLFRDLNKFNSNQITFNELFAT
nr:hypothetical protein [Lachnospiraceae bacterium]